MEKIKINGIELAYTRNGKGTPLVLLHGYPLDGSIWNEVLPLLEGQFDVIVPDLRGFGSSTTVSIPYTMDDYASDVAGLMDALKIEKAAFAGHSMGGYVALAFARNHPQRTSALGLVSSQVLADPQDRKEGRYKSAADVEQNGVNGVADMMASKLTADEKLQKLSHVIMAAQSPAAYIGALKAMAERIDSTPLLNEIECPVLLLHGDADGLIPVDRAREVKAALPSAHLVELPGVGHLPMLEAPAETAKALVKLA